MKSIHVKLNEALEALDKEGKRKQYNEKVQPQMNVESRLNLAEAILGVMDKEVVRHAAAEAQVAAARIEAQQVVPERFLVRGPQPPDFNLGR